MRVLVLVALLAVVGTSGEEAGDGERSGEGTFYQMRSISTPTQREAFINIFHRIVNFADGFVRVYMCPGINMDDATVCEGVPPST